MIFSCKMERGQLIFNRQKFQEYLKHLKDGRYWLSLERVKSRRSSQQNKFWHGVWLPIIAQHFQYADPEDACQAVKRSLGLCKMIPDPITKGQRWECKSTATMNVAEMSDFLLKVEVLMAEQGLELPQTEEFLP